MEQVLSLFPIQGTITIHAATVIVLAALPKIIKNFADIYFDIKTKKYLSDKLLQKLKAALQTTMT